MKGTYLYPPLIARFGRIDRSKLGSIDFGVVGPTRATRLSVRVRPVKRTCQHHDIDPFAYQIDMAEFKKED